MLGQIAPSPEPVRVKPLAATGVAGGPAPFLTSRGLCRPFGATPRPGGVNFADFSRHAQNVHLILFKEGQEEPFAEFALDPTTNKTGDVWHVFVQGLPNDLLYGYRVQGPHS